MSQINKENKVLILQNIFPILKKKNFVICSEHDLSISSYFEHNINLNEYVDNKIQEKIGETKKHVSENLYSNSFQEVEIF